MRVKERTYEEREADRLKVGDRVWFYKDCLIHLAEITEARTINYGPEEEGRAFTMYRVKWTGDRNRDQVHRSEIYRIPGERSELIREMESDRDRLERYLEEIEDREDDYIPDPERDDI